MLRIKNDGTYMGAEERFAGAYADEILRRHEQKPVLSHPDASVTDAKIGVRTVEGADGTSVSGTLTEVLTALMSYISEKQDALTLDSSPTAGSDNPSKSGGIYTALLSKANLTDLPTKTSDLTNDSGFLTAHQNISGKEDKANKVTVISQSSDEYHYPTASAVYNYVAGAIPNIDNSEGVLVPDDSVLSGKALKYNFARGGAVKDISTATIPGYIYQNNDGLEYADVSEYEGEPTNFVKVIDKRDIVTAISSASDDNHVPTAKAVYDAIGDIETALNGIIALQNSYIGA